MHKYLALLFVFIYSRSVAQVDGLASSAHQPNHPAKAVQYMVDTAVGSNGAAHKAKKREFTSHLTLATLSIGFFDPYRLNYSLPAGFEQNNFTGFPALYGKVEYGVSDRVSLTASVAWDGFRYNYFQLYTGYNGTVRRYMTDKETIFSAGIIGYYHVYTSIRHLDPFVGVGLLVDNIHHTAIAQGDSTAITTDHKAEPYLKVGARYYISDQLSFFGDIGYDHESIFSLGVSCRFMKKP